MTQKSGPSCPQVNFWLNQENQEIQQKGSENLPISRTSENVTLSALEELKTDKRNEPHSQFRAGLITEENEVKIEMGTCLETTTKTLKEMKNSLFGDISKDLRSKLVDDLFELKKSIDNYEK